MTVTAADQYRIEKMNGDSIVYKGKTLRKGDVFVYDCKTCIVWKNTTTICLRNMRTRNMDCFGKEDLVADSRYSFKDFFVKINHGSYRTFGDYSMSHILDNYFKLSDTIRVRTDDPNVIDVYTGILPESELPQYIFTYQYNGEIYTVSPVLDGDELVIDRQLFSDVPPHLPIKVSVYSINRVGQKRLITSSMFIEIL